MSIRVLITLLISFGGMYLSFTNAFYGLLAYAFWSYINPDLFTWGTMPLANLGFFVGATLVLTTLLQKRTFFAPNPRSFLIMLFWFLCLVSLFFNPETELGWFQFKYFSRVILITLIIPVLITDIKKFRYYLWAMVLCIGPIAAQAGFRGILSGQAGGAKEGYYGVIYPERNMAGAYLCIIVPVIFYMVKGETNRWLKWFLRVTLVGDVLAIILTYSRGAFLGMVSVILFMIMRVRRRAWLIIPLALTAVFVASHFLPEAYVERISTMKKYKTEETDADRSAAGRVEVWRSTLEMIKMNPFGVGFYRSMERMGEFPDPKTGAVHPQMAMHNTPLQVMSETGIPGFIVYFFIFAQAFFMMGRIKRLVTQYRLDPRLFEYASIFQAVFVAFFVTTFFANMGFMDISWHLVGLSIALELIARRELSSRLHPKQVAP